MDARRKQKESIPLHDVNAHVFFPRQIAASSENSQLVKTESFIAERFTAEVESFECAIFPSVVRRLFSNMPEFHHVDALDPKRISEQIASLQLGYMFGMYVREQNCALFIHVTKDDEATLSTFQTSLPNEAIYGDKVNGDIQVDYPTRSIKVKLSTILKSEEFAKQIEFLNRIPMDRAMAKTQKVGREFDEVRNVAQPMYISQWLMAAVSNRSTEVNEEYPIISKKMRDEIIKREQKLPFRRSGLYMAMKVFLQLGLTIELGQEHGKFLYKLVMLSFMRRIVSKTIDIGMQMIAKISRRMDKIVSLAASIDTLGNDLISAMNNVTTVTHAKIRAARETFDKEFEQIQAEAQKRSNLMKMPRLAFEQDITHQIKRTLQYTALRKAENVSDAVSETKKTRRINRHQWHDKSLPDLNKMREFGYYYHENGDSGVNKLLFLADVEHWVLDALDKSCSELDAKYLHQLGTKYMGEAQKIYENDCIGYSRMVLVMLKIIQVLDMIVVEEYGLFRDHSSGINPKIIENLLLPAQEHLKIAMKLQVYFEERNVNAQYRGLLEEISVSETSFSARFAAGNSDMQKTRLEILEMAESRIKEKESEVLIARGKVAELECKSSGMSHEFYYTIKGNRRHKKRCEKCAVESQIKNYTVSLYERPLKPQVYNQNAVVFELLIPKQIECLRDVLHLFVAAHYDSSLSKISQSGKWTDSRELSDKRATFSDSKVFLGSTSESATRTSYGRGKHPRNDLSEFVVPNGYDCTFFGGYGKGLPIDRSKQSVKKYVTFSVEISSVYSGLQWTLSGTSHTQNSVLAKQYECPEKLSLNEFINFGSLRADGHRLQLRNLYRALETEGLSFETQSVLAVVMQSMWEAGPLHAARSHTKWYREAHEDFADGVFAMEMIGLLEKFVEQQKRNWKHPLKLIVAATIAVRIFEFNCDEINADRIAELLLQIREIAIEWIALIAETMEKCTKEEDRAGIYASLAEVAICGVFTYSVSCHHSFFDKIFVDSPKHSSIFAWLHFMVTIKENSLTQKKEDGIKHLLFGVVHITGLNVEAKLYSLIENFPEKLHEFVRFKWPSEQEKTFTKILRCDGASQIISTYAVVKSETSRNHVQIDLVTGEFSVNNFSACGLPESISGNKTFGRVFKNTIFKVQPTKRSASRFSGCSQSQYVTMHKYNGFSYKFQEKNGHLIITEQRPNNADRELIPPEHLTGEIPHSLIENYSHWWDQVREIIEFRPKTFASEYFSDQKGVEYELDLGTRQLKHVKTHELLLDVCSDSYNHIVKFFSRLEQKNYIHVLLDKPKNHTDDTPVKIKAKAKVLLIRMNLKFNIDCPIEAEVGQTYDFESNEYCGMRVSLNQSFGTLIGLQNGLLLEAIPSVNKSNSKLLIVPHGEIKTRRGKSHVSVHIDVDSSSLRHPEFFIFQVDSKCQQIKANNYPGWFYLAYLHAVTSCALPDPFHGMTGTERALQILQSARVWSSSPYDEESIKTLRWIAALTPIRTFYPLRKDLKVMQRIQWPDELSSTAAQDSYLPIVQKLISDSERSLQLYDMKEKIEIKTSTYWPLNERDLARNSPFNPNCNVSETFVCPKNKLTRFEATEDDTNIADVRQLSVLYDENSSAVPTNIENSIWELLMNTKRLIGLSCTSMESVIGFCSANRLPDLWIRLYDCARSTGTTNGMTREHFHLVLSYLAFEGNDMKHLYILQAIATNAAEFEAIRPPQVEEYNEPKKQQYEEEVLKQIIKSSTIDFSTYSYSRNQRTFSTYTDYANYLKLEEETKVKYNEQVTSITQKLLEYAEKLWQCDETANVPDPEISSDMLELGTNATIRKLNSQLQLWKNNRKLDNFIKEIEAKLKQLQLPAANEFSPSEWPLHNVGIKSFPKYAIKFEEKLSQNFNCPPLDAVDDIERARCIFVEKSEENERTLADWWLIFKNLSVPSSERYLLDSGLYPRLIPSVIFPKLLEPICDKRKFVIGAVAVMTTREQRIHRIERFEHQRQMELMLRREHENLPHDNWMPHERPEWLLFEIEMDLSIRSIQVKIAERMIRPPDNQSSVMQLNMGEGKTAVIVPILAAVLADGNQLCSVTVLKSLFQTNLRPLRQCLGGMLNRRIYIFPCRRDMPIEDVAGDILSIYEECKRERGIVMTLPEYRLSFQLKIYEAARKGDSTNATHFLNVHNWLNKNARHILDESDAILDAKYQLIYTVGAQLPPDAGALRWKVIQAVLKRVPLHMRNLFKKYGDQAIEFNENYKIDGKLMNGSEVFQPCRLLDESKYGELMDRLIEDFLGGELNIVFPDTTCHLRELIRKVLSDPEIGQKEHQQLMHKFDDIKLTQETILILSGLLKFQVLQLALTKRYRVNYGVNVNGRRNMAVPFRAKDVAAEMTEFGHPDVAICFTHLSYYYSGLTDEQLYEIFDLLALRENPKEIYDEWIQNSIPYSGVNLSDPLQRKILFESLRFNMHVIDYWLSNVVFPREAKIFDGKLMCSAWDLSTEHLKHVVTGFSGTNDTKLVLPMPIVQNDFPELEATNEQVRDKLLLEENDHYRHFPSNVSGMEILHELVDAKIPVLLDAGALMLELDNEQVAREWLKLASEHYVAAIFFSKDDILLTIDRKLSIVEFESSVYRERLGHCLVYLDDVHTRGTDLKLPSGIRACVTLSGRITRDKTVQACMRMRMLGEGHMISFWASHEAHVGICASNKLKSDCSVNTSHVIKYVCDNSLKFVEEGLVHWSAAGVNYTQKLAAHKHFEESMDLCELSQRCTDPESTPLIEMYGAKEIQPLTSITRKHFDRLARIYKEHRTIFDWTNQIGDAVVGKLKQHIPEVVRYTLLDQEHERELENELEEERKVSRPRTVSSLTPQFKPLLQELFIHGHSHNSFDTLVRANDLQKLPMALANTKLFSIVEPQMCAWSDKIFITKDFLSVAQLAAHDRDDEFMRPVWWIARIIDPNDDDLFVLLSPFECNALLPTLRSSTKTILHMFCPKSSMSQSDLMNNAKLQLPANTSSGKVAVEKAVQITMFAGSMYFNDKHEETAFCNFMGYIPRPRENEEDQKAFEEGIITNNGYVPAQNRDRLRKSSKLAETCRFKENPDKIAIGIIERRFGYLSAKSHVSSTLVMGKRVRWDN